MRDAGLGLTSLSAMARSGQTGWEGTEWDSETSIRCLVGGGAQGTNWMVMTTGEQQGSITQAWSVDGSSVCMTQQGNRGRTGSPSVTVHGVGLGSVAFTTMGHGGQTGCEGTEWESETSIRCMLGHGTRGSRRIVMTAGKRRGTGSIGVSMDAVGMSMTCCSYPMHSHRRQSWRSAVGATGHAYADSVHQHPDALRPSTLASRHDDASGSTSCLGQHAPHRRLRLPLGALASRLPPPVPWL